MIIIFSEKFMPIGTVTFSAGEVHIAMLQGADEYADKLSAFAEFLRTNNPSVLVNLWNGDSETEQIVVKDVNQDGPLFTAAVLAEFRRRGIQAYETQEGTAPHLISILEKMKPSKREAAIGDLLPLSSDELQEINAVAAELQHIAGEQAADDVRFQQELDAALSVIAQRKK